MLEKFKKKSKNQEKTSVPRKVPRNFPWFLGKITESSWELPVGFGTIIFRNAYIHVLVYVTTTIHNSVTSNEGRKSFLPRPGTPRGPPGTLPKKYKWSDIDKNRIPEAENPFPRSFRFAPRARAFRTACFQSKTLKSFFLLFLFGSIGFVCFIHFV